MAERIVYVEWDGPYLYSALKRDQKLLNGPLDRGLYQVYVHHPIYGAGVLAYIGLAVDSSFHNRVCDRGWGEGSENDPNKVEVYVGRLKYPSEAAPSLEIWKADVANAERLLIHAHGPAYNSTNMEAVSEDDVTVRDVRVISFGAVRALHREVSGLVWTTASRRFKEYKRFPIQ